MSDKKDTLEETVDATTEAVPEIQETETEETVAAADTSAEDEGSDTSPEEVPATGDYKSGRKFTEFPLSDRLLQGLADMGYEEATQVQAATIEAGVAGRDMVVRAKTGTGKTCAFCVPMVEKVIEGSRYVQGIVLAPTRELANQIAKECAAIAKHKDLRVLPIYGGVAMGPQIDALESGVEIVVGTPGRILDHIKRGNLDLSRCAITALDEADEMLSMGFLEDVSRIMSQAPKNSQTLLFSATVEEKVKRLVSKFLNDPLDVMLSTDTDRVEGIRNILYESSPDMHRVRALMAIIDKEQPGTTIIFCNTREDTTTVANFLSRQGLDTQMLSGDLQQSKREQVMQMVRDGGVQFLVATDVAARGIDVSDITHVINYSLPFEPPVFMHRIGRTGRIGREGTAISLVGGPDIATRKVLETQFGIEFEERVMPTDEEASELRVERQVASIKSASGRTAFEAYLPLVRALKERPDGDVILATALRTFFQWDRDQRTSKSGLDSSSAAAEARRERSGSRDGGGGRGGGGGRNRNSSRDKRPRESREARDDSPRREAKSDEGSDGGNKRRRRSRNRNRNNSGGDSGTTPTSD